MNQKAALDFDMLFKKSKPNIGADLKSPLRPSPSRSPALSPALSPNRSPNKSPNISPGRSPGRSPTSSNYGSPPHGRHRSASIPVTPEALRGVRNRFLIAPGGLYALGESCQDSSNLLSVEAVEQKGRLPRSAPELTVDEAGPSAINPWNDDPNEYATSLASTVRRPPVEVLSRRFSETLAVTDYNSRHRRQKSFRPHHSRSLSFRQLKKTTGTAGGSRTQDRREEGRPRGNSVPCAEFMPSSRSRRCENMQRERNRSLSPHPSGHYDLDEDDNCYTLRNFVITAKGSVVNKGDLYKHRSRSNNSVASTASSVTGPPSTATSCSSGPPAKATPKNVFMLGTAGVGKTAIVTQFMSSEYMNAYDCSLEEDMEKNVSVLLDGEENELTFVDPPTDITAGDAPVAEAYVVVYSITNRGTFEKAVDVLFKLRERGHTLNKAVILVGNKSDLVRSRAITMDEGKSVACTYECKFIETSAAINHKVDELLVGIVTQIRLKNEQHEEMQSFKDNEFAAKSGVSTGKRMSFSASGRKACSMLNKLLGRGKVKSQSCGNLHVL